MSHNSGNQRLTQIKKVVEQMNETEGLPFRELLQPGLVEKFLAIAGIRFRKRIFDPVITLWAFVSQVISADSCCEEAVDRVNAARVAEGKKPASSDTSSYCTARGRLPESVLSGLARTVGRDLEKEAPKEWLWLGRIVKVVDGAVGTMPDTPENQEQFPQPSTQKAGLGFPMFRMLIVFSLSVGTVLEAMMGKCEGKKTGENTLFREIFHVFEPGDVVLGDCLFDSYRDIAQLKRRGADSVFRMNQSRKYNFRTGRQLGQYDHIVTWKKPKFNKTRIDRATYDELPDILEMRELQVTVHQPGFRSRTIRIVTTLLDATVYSKDQIAELFRERWHCELDIRSLKPVLGLGRLRCKTPEMVRKEFWAHLLAYNLIRMKMAQAAKLHGLMPRRLSFKGALHALRAYLPRLATDNPERHLHIQSELLHAIAQRKVGDRPDRSEPRKVKTRGTKYGYLTTPRPAQIGKQKRVAA